VATRSWSPRSDLGAGAVAACLAALVAVGCAAPAPVETPEPAVAPDPCLLPGGAAGEARELIVAMVRPEDSAAVVRPQPRPLIRLDCTGSARPAAAASWTPDSLHRTWTLVLAPSALGLTAASAATTWRTRPDASTTLRQAGVASVVPLDSLRLAVTLDWPDSMPALFADPSLGLVTDSLSGMGTRFVFRRPASGDPRDALDGGADIIRTGDPELVAYARTRDDFTVHALPWTRTYLLIIPADRPEFADLIPSDTAAFRAALARDAVHADARGAVPPWPWDTARHCPPEDHSSSPLPSPGSNAVYYPEGDPVARALAARVVALSDNPTMATASLPERAMAGALRGGSARAYIVGVPHTPLVPCRESATWPNGAGVIPLIDTRMSAIVRRGVPPLTVDFDGRLRPADAP
jgi:hypothetical protein